MISTSHNFFSQTCYIHSGLLAFVNLKLGAVMRQKIMNVLIVQLQMPFTMSHYIWSTCISVACFCIGSSLTTDSKLAAGNVPRWIQCFRIASWKQKFVKLHAPFTISHHIWSSCNFAAWLWLKQQTQNCSWKYAIQDSTSDWLFVCQTVKISCVPK